MEDGSSDGEARAQANHLKKRARKNKAISVVFDEDARKEFVTGFRKRKIQRRKVAEVQKDKRDRQKRLLERKERRQALKEARERVPSAVAEEEEQDLGDEIEGDGEVTSVAGSVIYEYGDALVTTVTTSAIVPEEEEAAVEEGGSTDNEFPETAIPRVQRPSQSKQQAATTVSKRKRKPKKPAVSRRRTPLKSSKRKRTDKANGKTRPNSKRRK